MNEELASLVVSVGLDPSKFNKGADQVESRTKRVAAGFKKAALAAAPFTAALIGAFHQTVKTGDALHKMSLRTGESVSSLDALRFAAERSGASMSTVERALRNIQDRAVKSTQGTNASSKAFRDLGIEVRRQDGSMKGAIELLQEVAGGMEGVEDQAELTAVSMELFGARAGPELLALLGEGTAGITALMEEAKKLGVMTDSQAKAAAEFEDAMTKLKQAWTAVSREIITSFLPTAQKVVEWFVNLSKGAKTSIGIVVALIGATGPLMIALGGLMLHPLIAAGVVGTLVIGGGILYLTGLFDDLTDAANEATGAINDVSIDPLTGIATVKEPSPSASGTGPEVAYQVRIEGLNTASDEVENSITNQSHLASETDAHADKIASAGEVVAQARDFTLSQSRRNIEVEKRVAEEAALEIRRNAQGTIANFDRALGLVPSTDPTLAGDVADNDQRQLDAASISERADRAVADVLGDVGLLSEQSAFRTAAATRASASAPASAAGAAAASAAGAAAAKAELNAAIVPAGGLDIQDRPVEPVEDFLAGTGLEAPDRIQEINDKLLEQRVAVSTLTQGWGNWETGIDRTTTILASTIANAEFSFKGLAAAFSQMAQSLLRDMIFVVTKALLLKAALAFMPGLSAYKGLKSGSSVLGGIASVFGFADGGIAMTPMMATVAEKEPEAIIPFSKMGKFLQDAGGGSSMAGGGITVVVNNRLDSREIASVTEKRISRNMASIGGSSS